jgi:hypothetical protein
VSREGDAIGISRLMRKTRHYFENLNLFPSIPPSTDPSELRMKHISTRSFIVSLGLSLAILLLYTSTVSILKTVTVRTPSLSDYTALYEQHPETLACPCTKVSVIYSTFL